MTTSQKLWLGFGTLTALLVLSSVAIIVRVRSIEGQVGEMANARNLSAAVRQLEINTLGYALDVRAYLQTGEPQARQGAVDDAAQVERQLKEYERLATTDRQRDMASRFAPLWQELKTLGQALLDAENRPAKLEDLKKFDVLRTGLEKFLDDEVQIEAVESYNARSDAAQQDVQTIVRFALILLIVGVVLAAVTSGTVGRAVVSGERVIAEQGERLRTTLASIGDGVIATDTEGRITQLNPVAESLTGWTSAEALGQPLDTVFRIVNKETRQPVENPVTRALKQGIIVGPANHTILIAKDGTERFIDESASPIRCKTGEITGGVLVFRDVTERKQAERLINDARNYAESVVETVREPLIILTADLRVKTANHSFYQTFQVTPEETQDRLIYELGNGQWNIPALRKLLEELLPQNTKFHDYEVEHDFQAIGPKVMLLNALRLSQEGNHDELILLAIEDITERKQAEESRLRQELLQNLVKIQEAERHRLARDIHDHLGQQLTGLRLAIAELKRTNGDSQPLVEKIAALDQQAVRLDRDASLLAFELRTNALDDQRLDEALAGFVSEWSRNYAIPANFHAIKADKRRLVPTLEINLYRIAQEALNNILKHSKATNVSVVLDVRADEVKLILEDDGVGFKKKPAVLTKSGHGFGLVGMHERAAVCGGTIEIESRPGAGTAVFVRAPASFVSG